MITITLTPSEQRIARWLAQSRYEANRAAYTTNQRMGPQSDEQTDIEGIGAELAFCKLNNLYPDLSTDHRPNEDAMLHNGARVDVKATQYRSGRLLVAAWKIKIAADIYALMVGKFPTYQYAGFATREEVFDPNNVNDLGHGEAYTIPQDRLRMRLYTDGL